jgi:hypothetical protein
LRLFLRPAKNNPAASVFSPARQALFSGIGASKVVRARFACLTAGIEFAALLKVFGPTEFIWV